MMCVVGVWELTTLSQYNPTYVHTLDNGRLWEALEKNRIPISCLHQTWPRRTGRGPDWKSRKYRGWRPPFLRDGPLKIFTLNLNISKTGRAIFAKF